MNKIKRILETDLTSFTIKVLESLGASKDRAELTAKVLVGADLRGIQSHGVAGGTGLLEIINRIDVINIKEIPIVKKTDGMAIATIDANGGLGASAGMDAVNLAATLASKHGIGKVHVYNSNHVGALCVYVEELLKRGFAARSTTTSGAWMIPFGGNKKRLGTTPIAWGIPCGNENIVIDMATSQRAISPGFRLAKAGEPIMNDYFLGKDGDMLEGVVSPEQLLEGSVLPLGGKEFGYKGSGLNILAELDNVIGGGSPLRIPSMREDPVNRISHVIEAWKIDFLYPEEEVSKRLEGAIKDIRTYGDENMLMPGEREAKKKQDSEQNGIPYEESQWNALKLISEKSGISIPKSI